MAFSHYMQSGGKRLRCGFTTGTCAALAAMGATRYLLEGRLPETLSIITPRGLRVEVSPVDGVRFGQTASCAVEKDAGDDIDVTDGLRIYAEAAFSDASGVEIRGGEGVGRVTKPGLDQPVGEAAINRVPRTMIREAVESVCGALGYEGGISITISVPEGSKAAEKTLNGALGIEGGISILGTSGIVEPMSMSALIDTITLELRQKREMGNRHVILTPGNYGMDFLRQQGICDWGIPVVKCSNFIGDALDAAAACGYHSVLLVGHAGKLVKLAGGIMNTHSRYGDCRGEIFCAHSAVLGADAQVCQRLLSAATTDACLEILSESGLKVPVLERIMQKIDHHLTRRGGERLKAGAVMFSNVHGLLGITQTAEEIISEWNREKASFMP